MSESIQKARGHTFFGHPRGLLVLAGTEVWDRISFHGMQALLVLYLVGQLLIPGHIEHVIGFSTFRAIIESVTGPLSTQALATQTFGIYAFFVYSAPLLGAVVGDRLLGRYRSVILGGVLMTAGHFSLAFDSTFLLAMLFLTLGAGFLRGNLQPQVGELYDREDRRRAVAFQVYGAAINLGAFIAPIVTGFLGQRYGWHYGFAFAGFGMLIGVVIYAVGGRHLPAYQPPATTQDAAANKLSPEDWRRVFFLLALVPVESLFWVAQSQVWNTYNLWVRDHIELHLWGWPMPIPWLQSLDGLAPLVMVPMVLAFWHRQAMRNREPAAFTKAAIGCFLFGLGTWWLGFSGIAAGADGRAPVLWAVVFHIVSNLGWIYFTPTMTAIVSRLAPASLNATMIGVNTLSVSLGSIVSGRLGGLYERVSPFTFWTIHAALVGLGGVLLLLIGMGVRQSTRLRFPLSPDGGEGKVGGESAKAFLPKPPPLSSSVP